VLVIGSLRQMLAAVIAVLAISGTYYLASHKLSNPDDYAYGECVYPPPGTLVQEARPCRLPTRAAWQIPLAVVIALGGPGAAVVVAGERPRSARRSRI
jgi:peptidoglycan/LPS O-acetylase OafA/YrhL